MGKQKREAKSEKQEARGTVREKTADGVCTRCGAEGTTVSFSTPGVDATAPICPDCLAKIKGRPKKTKSQPGAAVPHKKRGAVEDREVTGVKIAPDPLLVTISYDQPHGEDKISVVVESKDEPKQSLTDALQALAPHALAMCEIPAEWESGVSVRSVKMKHSDAGVGVVITCLKTLETKQVCCLNSPYTPENSEFGAQLTATAVTDLYGLMTEALAYVDGKRAQGDLFKDK